jgi:hypothetical protein
MWRRTALITVAVLSLLASAALDAHAGRCSRAQCRTQIAERCGSLSGVKRKRCIRKLRLDCYWFRTKCGTGGAVVYDCSQVPLGHPCGTCGTGVCAVGFTSCQVATCVQPLPNYSCLSFDAPNPCPGGTTTCVETDSYQCNRGLHATSFCAALCP